MSPARLVREPLYQQIADHYAAEIRAGRLADGDRIPAARQMLKDWGIAIATAQAVLDALKNMNLVRTGPRGTVVTYTPGSG
jgi:DNA-binding transcriptional regulator YhcF (GntR family)